jgi:hypothetical protein
MRSRKMVAYCLFGLTLTISVGLSARAQAKDELTEITDTITPAMRTEYNQIISLFSTDLPDASIKFREDRGNLVFIRLEDKQFCIISSCVTIVTTKCPHAVCQYVTALVPPRYEIVPVGSFWGDFIHFPATQSNLATTLVFNQRFIAAYNGL